MHIGIDFGTSNSLIATAPTKDTATLIPDYLNKQNFSPSKICVNNQLAMVGTAAEDYHHLYPNTPIYRYFKRNFGTQEPMFYDKEGKPWFAETLTALMLRKIKFDAEIGLADKVNHAVFTIPAHFNDLQRKSLIAAAQLADIKVAAIIEEPVAAALYYSKQFGLDNEIILVYDFGGGTLDLTIITFKQQQIHVLAKDGITNLGGREFTEVIQNRMLETQQRIYQKDYSTDLSNLMQLQTYAENLKIDLCDYPKEEHSQWVVTNNGIFQFSIDLQEFADVSHKLLAQSDALLDRCLRSIGITFEDISKVLLVGGSSNIPFVKDYFNRKINTSKQTVIMSEPFHAVAYGAAMYSHRVPSGAVGTDGAESDLKTVSTYNLGVQHGNGRIEMLIQKNTPLPTKVKITVNSFVFGNSLVMKVVQYLNKDEQVFELGTIKATLSSPNDITEMVFENKLNDTIGLKIIHAPSQTSIPFTFTKSASSNTFDIEQQHQIIKNIQINNIY
jgi:molecular chaperone DnaK (HSP70)